MTALDRCGLPISVGDVVIYSIYDDELGIASFFDCTVLEILKPVAYGLGNVFLKLRVKSHSSNTIEYARFSNDCLESELQQWEQEYKASYQVMQSNMVVNKTLCTAMAKELIPELLI